LENLMTAEPTSAAKAKAATKAAKTDAATATKTTSAKKSVLIKDFKENNTDKTVCVAVIFSDAATLSALMAEQHAVKDADVPTYIDGVQKLLKLTTTGSTSNMHLFNNKDQLVKYPSVSAIIDDYFPVRLAMYGTRKAHLLKQWTAELKEADNRRRFVVQVLAGTIDLRRKTDAQITEILQQHQLDQVDGSYEYLLKMPMDSVSDAKVHRLQRELDSLAAKVKALQETTPEQLWTTEINAFKAAYKTYGL
jgi:DNA topoisomerase-2